MSTRDRKRRRSDPWIVGKFNATSRLLGELRRTLGTRLAAKAAPAVLAKIGLPPIDVTSADALRQGELDLRSPTAR
jgi:hypothetical protein